MSSATTHRVRRAASLSGVGLALSLVALILTPGAVAAATWSSVRHIADGGQPAAGSSLATTKSPNHRYLDAVWRRGAGTIEFARSADGGRSWSAARVLARTEMMFGEPRMAASGSDVWVAWARRYEDPDTGTFGYGIKVRHNDGHGAPAAWDPAIRLTSTTGSVRAPSIAVTDDGRDIYVLFSDLRADATRLVSSHDRGRTWASTTVGTGFDEDGDGVPTTIPVVAASGSNVVVAWLAAGNVATARVSTDGGAHWSVETELGSGLASAAAKGGRLAVGGTASGDPWVRVWRGGAWGELRAIPTVTLGGQTAAAVELEIVLNSDGRVGAAYSAQVDVDEETADTWEEVVWLRSPDDGATWGAATRVSRAGSETEAYDAARPTAVWLEGGRLWIAWLQERAASPGHWFFALRERR